MIGQLKRNRKKQAAPIFGTKHINNPGTPVHSKIETIIIN